MRQFKWYTNQPQGGPALGVDLWGTGQDPHLCYWSTAKALWPSFAIHWPSWSNRARRWQEREQVEAKAFLLLIAITAHSPLLSDSSEDVEKKLLLIYFACSLWMLLVGTELNQQQWWRLLWKCFALGAGEPKNLERAISPRVSIAIFAKNCRM